MDRLLNISDRTNAVLHALALAAKAGGSLPSARAAEELGVSPSYLAKTLQPVAKAGILESSRGASGGYSLVRAPESLSCLEILELLDGPLPERACLFAERSVCGRGTCALKLLCDQTLASTRKALAETSVADLAASF